MIRLLLLALLLVSPARAQFAELLADVVTEDGLVRYDRIGDRLDPLLADWAVATPPTTDAAKMAFWINAYNGHMMARMAEQPDRVHVLEGEGDAYFFETPVTVAGLSLTLDEIENAVLRRLTEREDLLAVAVSEMDPRLHVAVNCAAVSCPRLWPEPYTAAAVDEQLDRGMRAFVNSPDHIAFDDGGLVLSSLLDWYEPDWDATGVPAGDWLLSFMSADRPDYERIRQALRGKSAAELKAAGARYRYDWTVNRAD